MSHKIILQKNQLECLLHIQKQQSRDRHWFMSFLLVYDHLSGLQLPSLLNSICTRQRGGRELGCLRLCVLWVLYVCAAKSSIVPVCVCVFVSFTGGCKGKAAALPGRTRLGSSSWAGETWIEGVATSYSHWSKELSKTTRKWCRFKAE